MVSDKTLVNYEYLITIYQLKKSVTKYLVFFNRLEIYKAYSFYANSFLGERVSPLKVMLS